AEYDWTTFTYSPSYTKNNCDEPSELPSVATESSCGRQLGLRFHRNSGNLYIADAYMGLMRATVLATEAAGEPFCFTKMDVDQVTGDVYFTDSSKTYQRSQHQMVTTTGDSTGRIMKYDPRTNQVTVLQSGSSIGLRLRYWIRGPKANTSEIFADLPGYPNNVRPDGKGGGYWIALHREKFEVPFGVNKHLVDVRIGAQGEKLQEMTGAKSVRPTEVVEREDGKIYLGSVELSYVGIMASPRPSEKKYIGIMECEAT
ncbi:hypothetical protein U9M48_026802, partial [Paspalum notatum var. saurae]